MRARSAARGSGTGVPARGPLVDEELGSGFPGPGGSPSFAGTAAAGSLGPVAASEMGPVIGLPNPGGVPRPAVSHMQPVDPGVLLAGAWEGAGKQDTLVQRRTGRETGP